MTLVCDISVQLLTDYFFNYFFPYYNIMIIINKNIILYFKAIEVH